MGDTTRFSEFASSRRSGSRMRRITCFAAASLLTVGAALVAGTGPASANTGTITANGPTVTATVSSAGVPATFTFSGTSGEVVTASAFGGTFAQPCDVNLLLLDQNGDTVSAANCVGTSGGFIGETALPGAGTYTLELSPSDSDLGSVTVSLSANPAAGTITANGSAVTFTVSHTGQGQNFTFSGKKNEVVTVSAYNGTFPGNCDVTVVLLDSARNQLGNGGCSAQQTFIPGATLEGKGVYTIEVVPQGNNIGTNTGSLTIALTQEPANGTITADGPAVTFTASHTGGGQSYTFNGSAGEVVTVSAYNGTFPGNCDLGLYLIAPSGAVLVNAGCASQQDFIADTALAGAGTYTIALVPQGNNIGSSTGSVTIALTQQPAKGSITENGAAVTFSAGHTGEGQNFTFKGKGGQVVSVSTYNGTFPGNCDLGLYLIAPSGAVLVNAGCASQQDFIAETTLPAKGTYTIALLPQGDNIGSNMGSVALALSLDAPDGSITANGPTDTFTSTNTGQGQAYTFSGTVGQTVSVSTSGGTFSNQCDLLLELLSPSMSQVGNATCAAQSGSIAGVKLPGTGTYTVVLHAQGVNIGSNTGSVGVKLTSP